MWLDDPVVGRHQPLHLVMEEAEVVEEPQPGPVDASVPALGAQGAGGALVAG